MDAYYKDMVCPAVITDCFNEEYNNLPAICKELGKEPLKALMAKAVITFMLFKGQKPFADELLDMLLEQILEECWMLNLADFKLCLKMHLGDKVYGSLSAGDILGMFKDYKEQRLNTADDMSYNEHLQTKGERRYEVMPIIQNMSNKFNVK